MKKLLVVSTFTLITTIIFAQKPESGDMGIGFNITGLANVAIGNYGSTLLGSQTVNDPLGLFGLESITVNEILPQNVLQFKHYMADDMAIRVTLGINSFSQKTDNGDSAFIPGVDNGFTQTSTKWSAFSFGLGVGAEKHMGDGPKADPYLGAEIQFGMLGKLKYHSESNTTGDSYNASTTDDVEYPGGISLGINLLGGFNYFFSDNISIGGEVGLGFGYAKTGGDWTSTSVDDPDTGDTVTTSGAGTAKSSNAGFNVNSTGSVNLTVFW